MKEGHCRKDDQLSRVYATMQQPIVDAESRRVDERAECGHADATFRMSIAAPPICVAVLLGNFDVVVFL